MEDGVPKKGPRGGAVWRGAVWRGAGGTGLVEGLMCVTVPHCGLYDPKPCITPIGEGIQ